MKADDSFYDDFKKPFFYNKFISYFFIAKRLLIFVFK